MGQKMCRGTRGWEEWEHLQACVGEGGVNAVPSVNFWVWGFENESMIWMGRQRKEKGRLREGREGQGRGGSVGTGSMHQRTLIYEGRG